MLICSFLCLCVGFLPYAEKPHHALSKDAYSSADTAPDPVKLPAWGTGSAKENHTERWLLPPANLQWTKPPEMVSISSDRQKHTKSSLENSTGLRKHLLQYGGALPLESPTEVPSPASLHANHANRKHADRRLAEAANSVSAHFHHTASSYPKAMSLVEAQPFPDPGAAEVDDPYTLNHFNRPGKMIPYKRTDPLKKITRPSWVSNRQSPSLLYHVSALKKGKGTGCSGQGDPELSKGWVARLGWNTPKGLGAAPLPVCLFQMLIKKKCVWPSAGKSGTKQRPTAPASLVSWALQETRSTGLENQPKIKVICSV